MRHAYLLPNIDEQKMKSEAEHRDGPTLLHRHRYGELCNAGCFVWPVLEPRHGGA